MQHLYDGNYEKYLYSGAQGLVMGIAHKMMELGIPAEKNRRILEVGGGAMPHLKWLDRKTVNQYVISDTRETLDKLRGSPLHQEFSDSLSYHVFEEDPLFDRLEMERGHFSRVIASHVWEHVADPEGALKRWVSLLEDDGIISIGLPCDPGMLWRLGQRVSAPKFMRLYNVSFEEYELHLAHEHVNAAQRLLRIFRYHFRDYTTLFFPFLLPMVEINLLVNLTAKKADFAR